VSLLDDIVEIEHDGSSQIFRVRETETHYIDVAEMLFNWRVVATPKNFPYVYDAAYCYVGKDVPTFMRAVLGARVWGGPGTGDPPGYDKNPMTGEWNTDRS
jgi:hypothetical protein